MNEISAEEQAKQIRYRDARTTGEYDNIWKSVGKCVFCDLRDKYIFFEENNVVMTVSLYAYIDGQFMIIPRRHVRSARDLTQIEWETIRKFMYLAKKMIREVTGLKAVHFIQREGGIIAQSTVEDHFHILCMPFDAPDLSVWNYRKLKHTPLETADAYRNAGKKLLQHNAKFIQKYQSNELLPIVCDAVIINDQNEILLQKRNQFKLNPDYHTLPGGRINSDDSSLEHGVSREVNEEVGLQIPADKYQLVSSQQDQVAYQQHSSHLNKDYSAPSSFIRNTYLATCKKDETKLQTSEEIKEAYWINVKEALTNAPLSIETKKNIISALKQLKKGQK